MSGYFGEAEGWRWIEVGIIQQQLFSLSRCFPSSMKSLLQQQRIIHSWVMSRESRFFVFHAID